jgi:hypothetical protein
MQGSFTGKFSKARIGTAEFDYSPCLHIKTFRVANAYGDKVVKFKRGIENYFKEY